LIELLVVVAIIALLISILLPSLNRARAQARTTVCLSRITQLGKAFLMYADDYDGGFPFLATMHEGPTEGPNAIETWLADWQQFADPWTAIDTVGRSNQAEWGDYAEAVPRTGSLFIYTRFENLYLCPEFQRQPVSEQHVFNYTRALWARQWRMNQEYEAEGLTPPSQWGGVDGPILKVTKIHSPADLPMMLDEQWNRHVGTSEALGHNDSGYNCNDYGFYADNVVATSHGSPVRSQFHERDDGEPMFKLDPYIWKRGGIFCYDGHAELRRDPWPSLELGNNGPHGPFRAEPSGLRFADEIEALIQYMIAIVSAQRGFDPQDRYGNPPIPW